MKITGMARLGSDMEIRFLPNGDPVGQVSLAFKLGKKDKATGEYQTTWVSASMFGKRAESMAPYMVKGSLHCFYMKDLHLDEFTSKDGDKRVSLKAIIDDIEFGGGKSESAQSAPARNSQPEARKPSSNFDDMEDDIPF